MEDIVAVADGTKVGEVGTCVTEVWAVVGVAGTVVLSVKCGVFVKVGKNGNDVGVTCDVWQAVSNNAITVLCRRRFVFFNHLENLLLGIP